MENFGSIFYNEIKRLIDDAIIRERETELASHETYLKLGLIESLENLDSNEINNNEAKNDVLDEFKELIVELGLHANEYNRTISKFFGRYDLVHKV